MRRRMRNAAILILLGLTACGCRETPSAPASKSKDPPQVGATDHGLLMGTLSCSGRGCHAAFERPDAQNQPLWRSSYTRWLHNDPHARAYRVLFEPLAVEMGKKLGVANVAEEPRCLVCHSTPLAARNDSLAREERTFGVGCEACHGPARDWLVPHRDSSWRNTREEYDRHGMNYLRNQTVRADVCAGCHIGAPADDRTGVPARDVTHDFIAAGHPRLMFEYGSFLANLPKHWTEKDQRPDFEARAWLVGQAVSAQASLRLLIDRAGPEDGLGRVWPELAEYDCYACHHGLDAKSWRQKRGYASGQIGALRLARWYTALISVTDAKGFSLAELTRTMAGRAPSRPRVRLEAKEALKPLVRLAPTLEKRTYDRAAVADLREKLVDQHRGMKLPDWDEVEQIVLGLKALDAADAALRKKQGLQATDHDNDVSKAIDLLLEKLAFPPGCQSPVGFRREVPFDRELDGLFDRIRRAAKDRK